MQLEFTNIYVCNEFCKQFHKYVRHVKNKKIQKRLWVKKWLRFLEMEGFCSKLLFKITNEEILLYHNFILMPVDQFNQLLDMVGPHIRKQNTSMRCGQAFHFRLLFSYFLLSFSFLVLRFLDSS